MAETIIFIIFLIMSQYATILSTQPLITKAKKKEEKGAKKGKNLG